MPIDIKVPSVGESISEGTIARWFKKDGDLVKAEEPLFELETEKATTEIAAPSDGILHITVPEGKTVAIGSVVGRIDEKAPSPKPAKEGDGTRAPRRAETAPKPPPKVHAETSVPQPMAAAAGSHEPALSPEVRRLVRETGIDASRLHG